MKKVHVLLATLTLIFHAYSYLSAKDLKNLPNKTTAPVAEQGVGGTTPDAGPSGTDANWSFIDNFTLGANAAYGLTFPTGDLQGTGKQDFKLGESYSFGVNLGYTIFSSEKISGMVLFETGYSMKEMIKTNVVLDKNTQTSIGMKFTDFMLGYLGTYRAFYYEAGFFYGLKTWTWYQKYALSGEVTETALYDDKENWSASIYGTYIGLGARLNMSPSVDMLIGIRSSFSFAYGYTHDDKIRPNAVMLNIGFQKNIFK